MELDQIDFDTAEFGKIDLLLIGYNAKQSARDYFLGKCVIAMSRRELWRESEAFSLAHYFQERLGWDPHTTGERLRTALALEELPLLACELREGRVRWAAARELTRKLTPATEAGWIEKTRNMTTGQIAMTMKMRQAGDDANSRPRPELFSQVMRFDADAKQYAIIRREISFVRDAMGLSFQEITDTECLVIALQENLIGKMTVELTRCPSCRATGIHAAGECIAVEPRVADEAMCTAQVVEEDGTLRSRHISAATERAVAMRAGHRCEVPKCPMYKYCKNHHLKLFSAGGTHSSINLMRLCASHHERIHEGLLVVTGSRKEGFKFTYADGTELGSIPAADRVAAFKTVFDALLHARIPEQQVHDALAHVRSEGTAVTEEEILEAASRWLTTERPEREDGAGMVSESVAIYRVPQGTEHEVTLQ